MNGALVISKALRPVMSPSADSPGTKKNLRDNDTLPAPRASERYNGVASKAGGGMKAEANPSGSGSTNHCSDPVLVQKKMVNMRLPSDSQVWPPSVQKEKANVCPAADSQRMATVLPEATTQTTEDYYDCVSDTEKEKGQEIGDNNGRARATGETMEQRDQPNTSSDPQVPRDDDEWFTAIEGNQSREKKNTGTGSERTAEDVLSCCSPTSSVGSRGSNKHGLVRRISSSIRHTCLLPPLYEKVEEEEKQDAWYVRKSNSATIEVDEVKSHVMQMVFFDYVGPPEEDEPAEPEEQ